MSCLAQACSRADAQTERLVCQTERDMQSHKHGAYLTKGHTFLISLNALHTFVYF